MIKKVLALSDECIASLEHLREYFRAARYLFGMPPEEVPAHIELAQVLLQERANYSKILADEKRLKKRATLVNAEQVIANFNQRLDIIRGDKDNWKKGLGIVCSDKHMLELARRAFKSEEPLTLRKSEIGQYFDFTPFLPWWNQVPNYTLIIMGGGFVFSSPEYDLFHSMCWFYDESVRIHDEIQQARKGFSTNPITEDEYFRIHGSLRMMSIQTVINSFLVLEAYLNSLAHLFLDDPSKPLTKLEQLYLREETVDKIGSRRQKFVPIEDKLYEWVKIISPLGETFGRGKRPFQDFLKLKAHRDSIVHLSEKKVPTYNEIGFATAKQSVHLVLDLIEHVSGFVAPTTGAKEYPWWFRRQGPDGRFRLPLKLDIMPPDGVSRS